MIDRNRLTDRVTLGLLWLEIRRAVRPILTFAIGLAISGAAGWYIVNNINGGVGSTHTMQFEVADATGVVPGRAEVRFEGIEAGLVNDVQLVHGHAVLTVGVADKFGPVYRNATAVVRPNTALQDMYIDVLSRGTPSAGIAGPNYVVPLSQTRSPVNLSEVLNLFGPGVRAHLYDVLDQLGNGLADRGVQLRQAFIDFAPLLKIAGQISAQLATRAGDTKQLVHEASLLASVIGNRTTQVRNLVISGTTALQALATNGGVPLQQTIHELPATLAALSPALTDVNGLLPNLDRAVTSLGPVADRLPTALPQLRRFAISADPAVRALRTPVVKLVPLADSLGPFAAGLANTLTALQPQTGYVNRITQDVSRCPHQIDEFFNWTQSVGKYYDAFGSYPRAAFAFGFYTLPTFANRKQTIPITPCEGGQLPIGGIPTPLPPGPTGNQ
jgi:ABC-type transporter Mla subunit MlaD